MRLLRYVLICAVLAAGLVPSVWAAELLMTTEQVDALPWGTPVFGYSTLDPTGPKRFTGKPMCLAMIPPIRSPKLPEGTEKMISSLISFANLEEAHRSLWLGFYPDDLCRELTIGSLGKPTDPAVVAFRSTPIIWLGLIAAWQLKYLGDSETARKTLERVLSEFPRSPQALSAKRRLELLRRARS